MTSRNIQPNNNRSHLKASHQGRFNSHRKDSDSQEQQIDYRRVRVIQKNLVYVIGLTEQLAVSEVLESNEYFGRFGHVLKTIINKNTTGHKSQRYTAYVTFETELEASLAILVEGVFIQALDDYCLGERALKVSYGTTKYCSYFLKKYECPNIKDCYFLHKWDIDNELTVDDNSKQVFNKQFKMAMQMVADNIDWALGLHRKNRRAGPKQSLFPGIEAAIQRLVENNLASDEQLKDFYSEQSEVYQEDKDPDEENQQQSSSIEQNKSRKSNSISTTSSPFKLDLCSGQQLNSKCIMDGPLQDSLCVDNMIQKYIKKQIMKQSRLSQSRFGFAEKSQSPTQQLQKIKQYIDVYVGPKKY